MSTIKDPDLRDVLGHGDPDDLGIVADLITDSGNGRVSLASSVCTRLTQAREAANFPPEVRLLLAEEIQRFGGNTLANLFRGGSGVPYREVVVDVASHVKASFNEKAECVEIERAILLKILEKGFEKMSEQEKAQLFQEMGISVTGAGPLTIAVLIAAIRTSGFAWYQFTAIIANAVMKALLGRGLSFGATAALMRGTSVLAGPIGWAVTALWTAFDLASPAYRVTVPCVVQIAYMREKAAANRCPRCAAAVAQAALYCSACGQPLALALPHIA